MLALLRYPLLVLAVALAVAVPSGAEHCTTYTTSNPEVDLTALGGVTYVTYIDNDVCQPDCLISTWFYCENNGIKGLQRGDEVIDDTCHGLIESDTCML